MANSTFESAFARVRVPEGASPYDAWTLDPSGPLAPGEMRLEVERLNLDATSFRDLWERHGGDEKAIAAEVLAIVAERGKMHNPRTGSGGVLMGRVREVGSDLQDAVETGVSVVSLLSNTIVPLSLRAVTAIDPKTHQLSVEGEAVLMGAASIARIPADLPEPLALSVFDVCGVVPQTRRLVRPGSRLLVLGAGGKAGMLSTCAAAEAVGPEGLVVAVVPTAEELRLFDDFPSWVTPCVADATRTVELARTVMEASGGILMDAVVDCTSARGTEVGAVSCCREGGEVYFFNMATSFQAAALGAETVGRDVRMGIGFGLLPTAPQDAVELVRAHAVLRRRLEERVLGTLERMNGCR